MTLRLGPRARAVVGGAVALVAVFGLLLAYGLHLRPALRSAVDTFLRDKTVTLLGGIAPERVEVVLGEFEFNLSRDRLVIHGVRVTYGDTTAARIAVLKGSAPLVFLTGIDAWDMIFRRRLVLSGVRIVQPVLEREEVLLRLGGAAGDRAERPRERRPDPAPLTPDSALYSLNTADSTLYATVARWLPAELHSSHVERIHLENGTLVTVSGVAGRQATDTVSGFELDLRGLGIDGKRRRIFREALIAASRYRRDRPEAPREVVMHGLALRASPQDTALTLDSAALRAGKDASIRIVGLARSFSRQTLRVRQVALVQKPIDSLAVRTPRRPRGGLAWDVRDFAVDGMRFGPTFRRATIAERIDVGSVTFDLRATDGGSPTRSGKRSAPATRTADRTLPWGAAIDTFVIHRLSLRYTGLPAKARPPTTLHVEVDRPVLLTGLSFGRLVMKPATPIGPQAAQAPHTLDSLLYAQVARAVPLSLHSVRIESLGLENARVVMATAARTGIQRDSIGALTVHLRGLGYDSTAGRVLRSVQVSVPRLVHTSPGSPGPIVLQGLAFRSDDRNATVSLDSTSLPAGKGYRLDIARLSHDLAGGKLTVGRLRYAPELEDEGFFRSVGQRTTRVRLDVRNLAFSGFDAAAAARRGVRARKVDIGELQVDATMDMQYPSDSAGAVPGPGALSRSVMPTQQLARSAWAVAVDTVVLRAGAVRYTEITPGTVAPATISFDHLSAVGTGLANRKPRRPFDLRAFAAINGEGRIVAHFILPIRRGAFTADVSGTWTGMPLAGLNTFLVPSGFRFTAGTVDSTSYSFRIADDSALGSLNPAWRGLRVQLVNKKTGETNVGSKIKSWIAKSFIIRMNNVPGTKGYRASVPIRYGVTDQDTFFGTLWLALRSALIVAMKK